MFQTIKDALHILYLKFLRLFGIKRDQ